MDGKPVAPKLATLEVNLTGVFYCKQQPLATTLYARWSSRYGDRLVAVHLGMHYIKRNRTPGTWKAVVMIGSVGVCLHLVLLSRQNPMLSSVLDGDLYGATIYRLEARSAGSDARSGHHRRRGQHPHRRHPPVVRRSPPQSSPVHAVR